MQARLVQVAVGLRAAVQRAGEGGHQRGHAVCRLRRSHVQPQNLREGAAHIAVSTDCRRQRGFANAADALQRGDFLLRGDAGDARASRLRWVADGKLLFDGVEVLRAFDVMQRQGARAVRFTQRQRVAGHELRQLVEDVAVGAGALAAVNGVGAADSARVVLQHIAQRALADDDQRNHGDAVFQRVQPFALHPLRLRGVRSDEHQQIGGLLNGKGDLVRKFGAACQQILAVIPGGGTQALQVVIQLSDELLVILASIRQKQRTLG